VAVALLAYLIGSTRLAARDSALFALASRGRHGAGRLVSLVVMFSLAGHPVASRLLAEQVLPARVVAARRSRMLPRLRVLRRRPAGGMGWTWCCGW
jgi:hypothetical protein